MILLLKSIEKEELVKNGESKNDFHLDNIKQGL